MDIDTENRKQRDKNILLIFGIIATLFFTCSFVVLVGFTMLCLAWPSNGINETEVYLIIGCFFNLLFLVLSIRLVYKKSRIKNH